MLPLDVMTLRCSSESSRGFHLLWFGKTDLTFELGARQRCMLRKSRDLGGPASCWVESMEEQERPTVEA